AHLRKCTHFPEHSRKPLQIPARSSTTDELPSALRKPFCELDLHRRIRSFFLVPRGPQPGLDEYRQGIEIKRLVHRRASAEKVRASQKNHPIGKFRQKGGRTSVTLA